jgi:hypothetical protein
VTSMREIDFDRVVAAWTAAGGKNTGGILGWFRPPITTVWREGVIRAGDVGSLRFIGGDPGSVWEATTRGTYKVKDAQLPESTTGFRWDPAWRIVTIRDPESGERTIIDGNGRALRLPAAVRNGEVAADTEVGLICGELDLMVVRVAKSASSLWR